MFKFWGLSKISIRFTLAESFGNRLFALIVITQAVVRDACIVTSIPVRSYKIIITLAIEFKYKKGKQTDT